MRYLYYCNSTYQLLTIMNLHWHRKYAAFENIDNYQADLFILNSFAGAKQISELLIEDKTFDNVRLIKKTYNSGTFHTLYSMMDVVSPLFYLKDKHQLKRQDVSNVYDVIVVPKYSTIVGAIYRVNPNAKLHLYEDGLGTYSLNLDLLIPHSRAYKYLYRYGLAKDFTNFDSLYLNVPGLYTGDWKDNIIGIPKYDKDYLKHVRELFKEFAIVENEEDKDIYWLAQTLENENAINTSKELLESLLPYKDRVLYCPHPRWPEKEKPLYDTNNENQIWELKLLNMKDVDKKLLISIHSTACLTPKMLYDEEPYIIMFYQMIDDKVTERNEKFDQKIQLFVEMYKNQDKIMLPKDKNEFIACIDKFVNR